MPTTPVLRVSALVRSKLSGILRHASLLCTAVALTWAASAGAQGAVQHVPTAVAVGATFTQPVLVTFQSAGTVALPIRVVTQGQTGLDFQDAGGGSCTTQSYLQSQTCTVNVTVSPTAPGRRTGAVVLVDAANHVLASQGIDVVATGSLAVIRPGTLQTIAGDNPQWQYSSTDEGKAAMTAHIFLPSGVAMDGAGDLFISDSGNNRVRKVTPAPATPTTKSDITRGTITTYAGGDINTSLSSPAGLAMDGAGNLYIADSGNEVIRRIDTNGVMTTVAGQVGNANPYPGDGVLATAATLSAPWSVAIDPDGNLYIADTGNNAVRRVDALTGIITTVVSNLNAPRSLAFDPAGVLYVANSADNTVLRVSATGTTTTYVGIPTPNGGSFSGDGGAASAAHLNGPAALAFDPQGNLYIADSANNRVRRVDAASRVISTVAGNGGTVIDDTPMNSDIASFSGPYALFLDPAANLFVGDLFHNRVREVSSNSAILSYPAIRVTKTSAPQKEVIESDGTAAVTPGDLTAGNAAVFVQTALDPATTSCRTGVVLPPGSTCNLGVEFAPTTVSAPGSTTPGSFTFNSDATNTPDIVYVSGQVLTVEPTAINLTSSANPSGLDTNVTFTARVAETDGNNGNAIPTGTVTFTYTDGTGTASPLGSPVTLNGGIATVTVSTLTLGQHTIAAAYSGNTTDAAATASLSQSIVQNTNLVLTASPSPSYATQSVTLSAKLTSSTGGTPIAGATVAFYNGTTSIGSAATTDANGMATTTVVFPTATPANAPFQLSASFAGDSNNLKSTSNVVSQTVNATQTTTLIAANPSTSIVGNNVTLTATVASINGPVPTGTVTFKFGTNTLGTGTLNVDGTASLITSALPPGQDGVTALYGGDAANLGSTSAGTTVTVNRLPTNTTLTSSAPNANAGSTLRLSATVTLAAGQTAVGTLSGIVTFYDGATIIGSQQVSNGSAVLTTTTLAVGSHTLTASYGGNTNYDVSTSAAVAQTVLTSSSTTALNLSSSTLAGGKPLTMTATVTTAGVKATGTVSFTDGGTLLGTSPLNSSAVATLVTTLAVGPHNIVATYNADPNYSASSSPTASVTVTTGNTVLALGATPTSATYSASISLNASMTSNGALPSSPSVTLTDNGNVLATVTLNTAGSGSFTTSTLSVGTHHIVASYAGDANNSAAQSQTVTVTILAATTNTTLTSSAPSSHFGDTVTLQAVVSSGNPGLTGSVTFQDGGTNLGTVAINAAGVATVQISNFSVAQHNIVATYSGDSTHATSTSAVLIQSVVDPTNVTLVSNINPAIGGNAVTFTAQVAGAAANAGVTAAPTGTIVFHEGATVLGTVSLNGAGAAALTTTTLTVGSHNIVATYSGDIRYAGNDSAVVTQVIRNASSQSTLTTSANPAVYSAPLVLTAHVTGNGGAPTGNVKFLDGTTTIGQAALSTGGTAVFTTSSLAPGIHSLTAIYVGDSNNSTSTAAAVNEQIQQVTQISVNSSSNPALTLQQPTLAATVTTVTGALATGNVRFMDGSVLLGTSALSGGVATLVPAAFTAGTHGITAAYAGDTSDLASVSGALSLVVNLRPTQNTVTATLPTTLSGGVLTLISVLKYDGPVSPTGVTTFSTATGTIGSATVGANGIATLNVQGSAIPGNITATYSGDASYSASTSSPTDISTAAATNFTLAVTPATFSVVTKQFSVAQITIHSNDGFSDTINLGCGGLPYAATCTFDHDSILLPANGTVTVKVNIDTGSPLTSGGEASASVQTSHGSSALALLPAGAVLALLAFGRRRRNVPALLLLLLAACLMPVIGCGTINQQSTPAGKYAISINAVGQGTGVTLSQSLSMTVTQ